MLPLLCTLGQLFDANMTFHTTQSSQQGPWPDIVLHGHKQVEPPYLVLLLSTCAFDLWSMFWTAGGALTECGSHLYTQLLVFLKHSCS